MSLLLVVLLVFAAFAIDIGNGYNQRRQAQSAADAAVLAAAQQTTDATAASAAIDVSRQNLDVTPTSSDWAIRYGSCFDSGAAARGYTIASSASPCVRFTPNRQRIRVRVPDIPVETYFGGVVGVDEMTANAFAEAQVDVGGSSDVLPYGLPSNSASVDEACLKTGPNPNNTAYPYSACANGPTTGNFGRLDISLFGNSTIGTPTDCGQSNADRGVAFNTAFGVDHNLATTPNMTSGIHDRLDACANHLIRPSVLDNQTGNTSGGLNEGMYFDNVQGTGRPGRLAQVPTGWPSVVVRSGFPAFDNRPLWYFIPTGLTTAQVPNSCRAETFDNSRSNADIGYTLGEPPWRQAPYPPSTPNESKAHLLVCLADYRAASSATVLFGRDSDGDPDNRHFDIMDSPRFGFVPELWEATLQNDNHIRDFRAVFLQTAYHKCGAGGCDIVFSPGSTTDNIGVGLGGNRPMDAISAILFTGNMLPAPILEDRPGQRTSTLVSLLR